jgi:hypothetical protein
MSADPVPLTVASNEVEAEVIRGLLETAGIASFHRPTNFGAGATDGFTPSGPREVLVNPAQLEDARIVLEDAGI